MADTATTAIVGTGTLGRQIALQIASAGSTVRLFDSSDASLQRALDWAGETLPGLIEAGAYPASAADAVERLAPVSSVEDAIAGASFVIEAVPEDLELKRALFRQMSEQTGANVILATNSSSFKSRLLADVTRYPSRLMNAHFFGQPWRRPAVELMTCGQTDPAVLERAATFLRSCGWEPLTLHGESTGFIFNRIWHYIKREALRMVDEGLASPQEIDRIYCLIMEAPVGPFAWMDRAGLDVALAVERHWAQETGRSEDVPPRFFVEMVEQGKLGRKTGEGFFTYADPKRDYSELAAKRRERPGGEAGC